MQAKEAKTILAQVEKEWKKAYPEENFQSSFLNESIRWLYDQETKTAWLMNVIMIITIFISCMGLFGLAMFTAEQRTREIGIRKVLGATVTQYRFPSEQRFCFTGDPFADDRISHCRIFYESVVAGFCLPYTYHRMGLYSGRRYGDFNCSVYGEFSGHQGSDCQSGFQPSFRVNTILGGMHS